MTPRNSTRSRASAKAARDWERQQFERLDLELAEIERKWKSGAYAKQTAMNHMLAAVARSPVVRGDWFMFHCLFDRRVLSVFGVWSSYLKAEWSSYLKASKSKRGRSPTRPYIQYCQGFWASFARHQQMVHGASRHEAAKRVADVLSPPGTRHQANYLASRLASRPAAASTVLQWMDEFDCGSQCFNALQNETVRKEFERAFLLAPDSDPAREADGTFDFFKAHIPLNKWYSADKKAFRVYGLLGWVSGSVATRTLNPTEFHKRAPLPFLQW